VSGDLDKPAGGTETSDQTAVTTIDPERGVHTAATLWRTHLRDVAWLRTAVVLLVIIVVFWVLSPEFLTASNLENIVTTASILGIVVLGQTVVLISGGFDLSVGGVVPLAAVLFALFGEHHFPIGAMFALTVAVGGAVGLVNAMVVGRLGVNPLIATLGTLSITGGLAYVVSSGNTLSLTTAQGVIGNFGPIWNLPYFVWVTAGAALAIDLLLRRTVAGRLIYCLGGNPEACRVAGVRIEGVRALSYGVSGVFAAVAGICFASQVVAGSPTLGTTTTLDSITAAVLGGAALTGGVGTVPGAILGVLIVGTISDGLIVKHVQSFYEQIISGSVLIVAVAMMRVSITSMIRGSQAASLYGRLRPKGQADAVAEESPAGPGGPARKETAESEETVHP
jgi:ribose transport system permease protein